MTNNSELEDLQARYGSLVESTNRQNEMISRLQGELSRLAADRTRLDSQVNANQSTMQVMIDDYNQRDKTKNDHIQVLRDQLKSHGINPE